MKSGFEFSRVRRTILVAAALVLWIGMASPDPNGSACFAGGFEDRPSRVATLGETLRHQLATARIVAIGENHGHVQLHELLISTLEDPGVGSVVDDILVEWGNSRHQELVDRYLAGGAVSLDELAVVWRDSVSSPSPVWEAPIYRDFFVHVRRINAERKEGRSYRVLLGGPPVDWARVENARDLAAFGTPAESMFGVARDEILRPDRRGLLLAGGAHVSFATMVRERKNGLRAAEVTPLALLRLHYPGSVHAIRSMGRAGDAFDPGLLDLPLGSVIPVEESLASLPANGVTLMRNFDGTPFDLYGDQTLGDMVDSIIYWGAASTFERSEPDLCRELDDRWWQELSRRSLLLAGRDIPVGWRAECPAPNAPE